MKKAMFDQLMKQVIEETVLYTDSGITTFTCGSMKKFFVQKELDAYKAFIHHTDMVHYVIDSKYGDTDKELLPLRIFLLTSFALDYQTELE